MVKNSNNAFSLGFFSKPQHSLFSLLYPHPVTPQQKERHHQGKGKA
jgi:hypothetical protein